MRLARSMPPALLALVLGLAWESSALTIGMTDTFESGADSRDFTTAGVTAISVDLNNTGATDPTIRLSFQGPGALGSDPAAALAAVSELRIVHSPAGGFGGGFASDGGVPLVNGVLRVDNITSPSRRRRCC